MSSTPGRRITKHGELTQQLLKLAQTMEPGERFPSQIELRRRFHVSDRTVLRSLDDLQRAGWIVRRHGSGTFVADPARRERLADGATESRGSGGPAAQSRTIAALAVTYSPSRYLQYCLDELAPQAEAEGFSLVCHHAPNEAAYDDALPLEALQPRGFLVFHHALEPVARSLMARGHRVVLFGAPTVGSHSEVPTVYGNHNEGGYQATRHLLELGHRRLAYARFGPSALSHTLRWQGHLRALREAEQAGRPATCLTIPGEQIDTWRSDPVAVASYFRRPEAPTALLCWNDNEALSCLTSLQRADLRVPEDVSVVGYDNLPEGRDSLPALTTVDQHLPAQLRLALDLLTRPEPPAPHQSLIVMPVLVPRGSSAPPAG